MFKDFLNFEINYNYDFLSDPCDYNTWVTVKYTCKILIGYSSVSKGLLPDEMNDS